MVSVCPLPEAYSKDMLRASHQATMADNHQRITPSNASIAILGMPFDNVSMAETIEIIERMIASKESHYIATANVDFLVQSLEDIELRRILFDADLVVCDGAPIVWASGILNNQLKERVAGSDLVPALLQGFSCGQPVGDVAAEG